MDAEARPSNTVYKNEGIAAGRCEECQTYRPRLLLSSPRHPEEVKMDADARPLGSLAASLSMADAAEMLWVVLANVSGGDWTKQSEEWQEAAARWRDNYFAALKAVVRLPKGSEDAAASVASGSGQPVSAVSECNRVAPSGGDSGQSETGAVADRPSPAPLDVQDIAARLWQHFPPAKRDISALLAEVERLRAENAELLQREERAHERHRVFCQDVARNLGPIGDGLPRLALDSALTHDVASQHEQLKHAIADRDRYEATTEQYRASFESSEERAQRAEAERDALRIALRQVIPEMQEIADRLDDDGQRPLATRITRWADTLGQILTER